MIIVNARTPRRRSASTCRAHAKRSVGHRLDVAVRRGAPVCSFTDSFRKRKLSVVSSRDDLVSVDDAARLLGITSRQVRRLTVQGELALVARATVDRTSLERHLATRQGSRLRAWSEGTAWGALALLSSGGAEWIGPTQRSRLRRSLLEVDARQLVSRTRNRARNFRCDGHRSAVARLLAETVCRRRGRSPRSRRGRRSVRRLGGPRAAEDVGPPPLARRGRRRAVSAAGHHVDLVLVRAIADSSTVLAALGAAESLDARERAVGLTVLQKALGGIHA